MSYKQDNAPLRPKQKFDLAWRFTLDPASFGIFELIAGVRQANNSFGGCGKGAAGYGKRYAAAYGEFLAGTFLPPHVPMVAGRDRSADEGAIGTHASASIQTTMNVYGQAMPESKSEANGKVVTMVIKPLKASA